MYCGVISVIGVALKKPNIESIKLADQELYLDQEKNLDVTIAPKDADDSSISCIADNENITFTGLKVKAIKEGTTTIVCSSSLIDETKIKSNKATITVTLSEKQQQEKAEEARKEQEKAENEAKEKAEEAEKIKTF